MYYDAKGYKPNIAQSAAKEGGTGLGEYEGSLLHVGTIDTVCLSVLYGARLTRRALSLKYKSRPPAHGLWSGLCNTPGSSADTPR